MLYLRAHIRVYIYIIFIILGHRFTHIDNICLHVYIYINANIYIYTHIYIYTYEQIIGIHMSGMIFYNPSPGVACGGPVPRDSTDGCGPTARAVLALPSARGAPQIIQSCDHGYWKPWVWESPVTLEPRKFAHPYENYLWKWFSCHFSYEHIIFRE